MLLGNSSILSKHIEISVSYVLFERGKKMLVLFLLMSPSIESGCLAVSFQSYFF